MATAPKVKFKINPDYAETIPTEAFIQDDVSPDTNMSLDQHRGYLIILYTTNSNVDDKSSYNIYLYESRLTIDSYFERYDTVKTYAENQLSAGELTGFILHGFRVSSLETSVMAPINKMKKFQVKKKTFLNGPLKDNEFIQKKGNYYA